MTKTLNQIIFFIPLPKSEYFFQQHWESEYFFRKKTITPLLQVKWSFPNMENHLKKKNSKYLNDKMSLTEESVCGFASLRQSKTSLQKGFFKLTEISLSFSFSRYKTLSPPYCLRSVKNNFCHLPSGLVRSLFIQLSFR